MSTRQTRKIKKTKKYIPKRKSRKYNKQYRNKYKRGGMQPSYFYNWIDTESPEPPRASPIAMSSNQLPSSPVLESNVSRGSSPPPPPPSPITSPLLVRRNKVSTREAMSEYVAVKLKQYNKDINTINLYNNKLLVPPYMTIEQISNIIVKKYIMNKGEIRFNKLYIYLEQHPNILLNDNDRMDQIYDQYFTEDYGSPLNLIISTIPRIREKLIRTVRNLSIFS
uniref:Uncharacterized protein n=1 Tax=viral metagenome TaxID=1070528 RepID=A0A6C0AZ15_9ZZZZ|tara:strand:- start:16 stop:684 length:669 start_codon:yes stop_codon:yes gene_type:complete